MSEDFPDDADRHPSGPPLPPDDRLWRHPSELAARSADPAAGTTESRLRAWPAAALGVVAGAALATSGLVLAGTLSPRVIEHHVVEKVAVAPLASPVLGGDEDLDALVDRVAPALVGLEVRRDGQLSAASGVVFRDDGLVLTIAHPLVGAEQLMVVLADGRRLPGALVGLDELTDVAVVDVGVTGLAVAVLELAEDLAVGEVVVALGAPGEASEAPTTAMGRISGLDRWAVVAGGLRLHGLVALDADTDATHAGGPLVDLSGAVVGITTAAIGEPARGGFAVPMHLAHQVALHLVDGGEMDHAWLGVEAVDLDEVARQAHGLAGGALVRGIVPGSPADRAGLAVGDVVTQVDGRPVGSVSALVSALRRCAPGDTVGVGLWRDGTAHTTEVVVVERPKG